MSNYTLLNDTVVAIATPIGSAGVSIIRLSGNDAFSITQKIFKSSSQKGFEHSKFYYGWIIEPSTNNPVDEVIVLVFKGPKSYTTEDVIEIQCHGGMSVTQKILALCLAEGARLAEEGEFTKRAFIGGRIDLTQVEAVLDIISAKTDVFSSSAAYNLSGKLSDLINEIRQKLITLLAHITASLDFPEEVDEMPYSDLKENIQVIEKTINEVLARATDGALLKQGINITLVGRPNVGKSSLFNQLLTAERAIVTNIPGTTRDILQEFIEIDGIPVILCDTAGIRETNPDDSNQFIESIGVNRSKCAINESDLVIFIYDVTEGILLEDAAILEAAEKTGKPLLKLANKADLVDPSTPSTADTVLLSAKTGEGIPELKQKIKSLVLGSEIKVKRDEVYINLRHKECLQSALKSLKLASNACDSQELQDFISIDIKSALLSLDEMVGETVSEEILDHIFSQFCIGK